MDKRSVIAFIVIGLIALFMSTDTYRRMVGLPDSEQVAAEKARSAEQDRPAVEGDPFSDVEGEDRIENRRAAMDRESGEPETPAGSLDSPRAGGIDLAQEELLPEEHFTRVETDRYIAVFSDRGASIVRFELKGLKSYYGETILLIDQGSGNLAPAYNLGGTGVSSENLPFELVEGGEMYLSGGESGRLVYVHEAGDGSRLEKSYELTGDSYRIDFGLFLDRLSTGLRHGTYGIRWDTGLQITEQDTTQDMFYAEALAYLGNEVEGFQLGRKQERAEERRKGNVHWAAARSKYFEVALVPLDVKAEQVFVEGWLPDPGAAMPIKQYAFELEMPLESNRGIDDRFALYIGPLDKRSMLDMDPSLRKSIMTRTSLGFFGFMWPLIRPIANGVLWTFKKLHLVIPNFGVVIIVFSFLVKILVWPLTHRSYQSMKEMQKIKPLQEELRKKFGKDPKRMQQETMKLYREHKVNPLGGCLPNLLQMPLLISMYFVFRAAFDLRGASFIWWIKDLAVPDAVFTLPFSIPFYGASVALLPIIFAISNYFMMSMTMTDPKQKPMLIFMPVMMLMIFNQFPSGLTLYYTLFNVLSTVQQHFSKGMILNNKKKKKAA